MSDARERVEESLRIGNDEDIMILRVSDFDGQEIMRITPDAEMVIADRVTPRDVAERLMDAWDDLVADALRNNEGREVDRVFVYRDNELVSVTHLQENPDPVGYSVARRPRGGEGNTDRGGEDDG